MTMQLDYVISPVFFMASFAATAAARLRALDGLGRGMGRVVGKVRDGQPTQRLRAASYRSGVGRLP